MDRCIICNGTTRNSKYCSSCKSKKDRAYTALNRGKKKIYKLLGSEKYDAYRFIKLEGIVKDMRSNREVLLEYIDRNDQLLIEKASR